MSQPVDRGRPTDRLPPAVRERVETVKVDHGHRLKAWVYRQPIPDLVTAGVAPGAAEDVRCKRCAAVIAGLRPIGNPIVVRADERKVHAIQPMLVAPLAYYVSVVLEMDDGGKHVTPLCRPCAEGIWGADDLEALYAADVDQIARAAERDRMPPEQTARLMETMGARRPVRLRLAEPGE